MDKLMSFEVKEVRENHDAALPGYIFLLLISFSFVNRLFLKND